jgi:hypothetical protein
MLISMQDRCMVCAKHQKSVWMHLILLVRDVGQVEARFNLFGDSVNLFFANRDSVNLEER